jgi:hypothetical protein
MKRACAALAAATAFTMAAAAQDRPLEYRVKAAYLYNFVKFVEWPEPPARITICVAGANPFGDLLSDLVRNERVRGIPLEARVIADPDSGCHVLFVPSGITPQPFLRPTLNTPTLTVGETPGFIEQGGIVRFYQDGANVRFEISREAADRRRLRISARLLQLAKIVEPGEGR